MSSIAFAFESLSSGVAADGQELAVTVWAFSQLINYYKPVVHSIASTARTRPAVACPPHLTMIAWSWAPFNVWHWPLIHGSGLAIAMGLVMLTAPQLASIAWAWASLGI